MVTLPPEYVREHVAPATRSRSTRQGKTVDRGGCPRRREDDLRHSSSRDEPRARGNCAFVTPLTTRPRTTARRPRSTLSNCITRISCGARGATGPRTTCSAATSRARRDLTLLTDLYGRREGAHSSVSWSGRRKAIAALEPERSWWTHPTPPRRGGRDHRAEEQRSRAESRLHEPSASRSGRTFPAGSAKLPVSRGLRAANG